MFKQMWMMAAALFTLTLAVGCGPNKTAEFKESPGQSAEEKAAADAYLKSQQDIDPATGAPRK